MSMPSASAERNRGVFRTTLFNSAHDPTLLVDEQGRVGDDVNRQDVGDLEFKIWFVIRGHGLSAPIAKNTTFYGNYCSRDKE